MNTPIVDFVSQYADADFSRFHMPGHKGHTFLGCEKLDITEIDGADVLYMSDGIIKESEENTSSLFNTSKTFFSTEGSSLAIRAMIGAVCPGVKADTYKPLILAARNVHKAFIYACAAIDVDVQWIYPENYTHLCSCPISADDVEQAISRAPYPPTAVYLTSPDYLGNITDIAAISSVCEKHGVLLLVDNAHGAYLHFLETSLHPIHLGAHICCDSAHKTLPVLTGGAYLHFSQHCPEKYIKRAQKMLSVFASTSPSYLILQSLDLCNKYLADDCRSQLLHTTKDIFAAKDKITEFGFAVQQSEPLKIVVNIKKAGLDRTEFCNMLTSNKISLEMCDDDFAVFMVTPQNNTQDIHKLVSFFEKLKPKQPFTLDMPENSLYISSQKNHNTALSIRQAVFADQIHIPAEQSLGRICAAPVISCPPAVPIVISGEIITKEDIELMKKYHIEYIDVVS
ncbi:MAG: hypothetical protein E7385_07535 [Ruminococcaceae bacterium]|nr:hypothetical protein [Oscillospiraceae bacterium]